MSSTSRRAARLSVAVAFTLAAAAPASAGTVSLEYEPPIPGVPPEPAYELVVRGGSGAERLTLTRDARGFAIADSGGIPLTAREGCTRTRGGVFCPTPETATQYAAFVTGSGGSDIVDASRLAADLTLRGGDGNDALGGSPGNDVLAGGDGDDWIGGGAGDDRIQGGPGSDLLGGGPGSDSATYRDHRSPVRVDLKEGSGGSAADPDRLWTIESVTGGPGDDSLYGDDGSNQLQGGGGRDLLAGRGAGDILSGHRVLGGPGPDRLDGNSISCGSGRDDIVRYRFRAPGPYARDCERVLTFFVALSARPTRAGSGAYRFTAWCSDPICRATVDLVDDRGRFGRGRFSIRTKAGQERSKSFRVLLDRQPARRTFEVRVTSDERFRHRYRTRRPGR